MSRRVQFLINIFILDRTPEPLNVDVVNGSTCTVHTHSNASRFNGIGERICCKLDTLVGIEDKSVDDIETVRSYLFREEEAQPSQVGEKCFDVMLKEARQ